MLNSLRNKLLVLVLLPVVAAFALLAFLSHRTARSVLVGEMVADAVEIRFDLPGNDRDGQVSIFARPARPETAAPGAPSLTAKVSVISPAARALLDRKMSAEGDALT